MCFSSPRGGTHSSTPPDSRSFAERPSVCQHDGRGCALERGGGGGGGRGWDCHLLLPLAKQSKALENIAICIWRCKFGLWAYLPLVHLSVIAYGQAAPTYMDTYVHACMHTHTHTRVYHTQMCCCFLVLYIHVQIHVQPIEHSAGRTRVLCLTTRATCSLPVGVTARASANLAMKCRRFTCTGRALHRTRASPSFQVCSGHFVALIAFWQIG